ncbi:MAG: septal ring lytic transglycosylase RlpA family protein [Perlucidibaca sp.]
MTRTQRLALLAAILMAPAGPAMADDSIAQAILADTTPYVPPPDTPTDHTTVNWQQWVEAAESAQQLVDMPITDWGLLPDPVPDEYPGPILANEQEESFFGARTPWLVDGERYDIQTLRLGARQEGEASWYGPGFNGRLTASGEIFDMHELTAAHRTLPLPSFIRVTNLSNQQTVIVKVNDRGPYHNNRILDLSYAAARRLDIAGVARVSIEPVERGPTGHARGGKPLPSETVYSVLVGSLLDEDLAHLLQTRLQTWLPPGIPVNIKPLPGPLQVFRVEVGPLLSRLEVNLFIRTMRAVRSGLAPEVPRVRLGR